MRLGLGLVVVGLVVAGAARAGDGLRIEPGAWEFTSQTRMPAGQSPPPMTRHECILKPEVTPERFNNSNSTDCSISDVKTTASAMSWTMTCPSANGKLTGKGRVTSTGKKLAGKMAMTVSVEDGQTMEMDVAWTGKYLGPCK